MEELNSSENEKVRDSYSKLGYLGKLKRQMYSRFKQPITRPRRELTVLDRKIPSDWQREKEEKNKEKIVAPLNQQQKNSYSWQSIILVLSMIIFIGAGGFVTYLFVTGSNVITARKIEIDVNGPRTIDAGDIFSLQISVLNNNNVDLELADLIVTYPEGARSLGSISATIENQRVELGTIKPGGTQNGVVKATIFGKEGDKQDIKIVLEYRLKGSGAIFSTEEIYTVLISSSALSVVLKSNTRAVSGQQMGLTVEVTAKAKNPVRDVVLQASYPFGFSVMSTVPEVVENNTWNLGDIIPGETKIVRILGVLDGQDGDTRIFKFLAGAKKSGSSDKIGVVLADFEQKIKIERPFLGMSLSYKGVTAKDYIGIPGERIPIVLSWRNNLSSSLSNVVIAATITGEGFDPFKIGVDKGFYKSASSPPIILWDKTTTNGDLKTIAPGEQGRLTMYITPRETRELFSVKNPTIVLELHATGQRLENNVPEIIKSTVRDEIKIQTDLIATARALYKENPLGSIGPLPPKVENKTTYGILWEISNSTNLIQNGVLTANLPPYVEWLGTVSPAIENITYNPTSREVSWNLGNILENTGDGVTLPRRVIFSIELTPSISQIGKSPVILLNQEFQGKDTFTDKMIQKSMKNLTTKLNEIGFADFYSVVVR